jgi:O-antigen/teichoic acid export membrane protein
MTTPLKQQALHGAFWSFTEKFGLLGVQFIVSIILARLLSPSEFGLLAMVSVFSLLAQVVVESGFGQALIQKQDATHTDESTAFWFNLLTGCLMTLSLYFCAPAIASFYEQTELEAITRVVAFNLVINSFSVVQNALLQKELLFRQRTIASLTGVIISGAAGIIMAMNGYGVWALVIQILANNAIRTLMLWIVHPWRPAFLFSTASFRTLFKFGSNLLLSGLSNTIFNNIYLLIIGKLYSATALGYYQKAKEFILASSTSFSQVIAQVNFPVMSKLQEDPERMRGAFREVLQNTLFIIFPGMIGLAITAPSLIYLLIGEKWMPCVPYLQLLCVNGSLIPVHLLNLNIITALGHSGLFFRLEILRKILVSISILLTYRYGVIGLLYGQVTTSLLALLVNCHFTHRYLNYGLLNQLKDNARMITNSAAMGILLIGMTLWLKVSPAVLLALQTAAGITLFVLLSWLLRDRVFTMWKNTLLRKLGIIG